MATGSKAFAAVVLAIYTIISLPTLYIIFRHGVRGMAFLGWFFLLAFCTLRIVGSAMELSDPESTAASTISSVGLSPLVLALGGVLHEARHYRLSLGSKAAYAETIGYIVFHVLVTTAVALTAIGASNIASDQNDPTKLQSDWHLAGTGTILMLVAVSGTFATALLSRTRGTKTKHPVLGRRQGLASRLASAAAVAAPLAGLRVLGSTAFYFSEDVGLNPVSGDWAYRILMYFLPELAAAVTLVMAGMATRDIARRGLDGEAIEM